MLHAVKPPTKFLRLSLAASLAVGLWLPQAAVAFDAKSVLKMHVEMNDIENQVQQIQTQDVEALNRIKLVESELNKLRGRLQQFENELAQTQEQVAVQNQLIDGRVLQEPLQKSLQKPLAPPLETPLENPYSETASLAGEAPAASQPLADNDQELNTIPEALLKAKKLAKPEAQAFAASPLPEAKAGEVANIVNEAGRALNSGVFLVGSLGNQSPDVTAFNEAKGYFDDSYYVLSERKFNQFIQYYRQSPLISNAYFWLGESYYMRENYNAAARVYYQGYRTNKKGAKAPDNLFKLAASLLLLGNKSDACAAYFEVWRRYSQSHPHLSGLAVAAQKQQAC